MQITRVSAALQISSEKAAIGLEKFLELTAIDLLQPFYHGFCSLEKNHAELLSLSSLSKSAAAAAAAAATTATQSQQHFLIRVFRGACNERLPRHC